MNMTMTPQPQKQLEDSIEAIWRQGTVLSPDALHYIDSTFSAPSLPEMEAILGDESSCETDSLLELIFFPDQSFQIRIEELLERSDFRPDDEETISRTLTAKKLQTTLIFPAGRGRLTLSVPDWIVARFIGRLNISKKLDPALIRAIGRYVARPDQTLCKVKLRNTRFEFTPNKIGFLTVFFEKTAVNFKQLFDAIDFVISFFEEIEDDTDLYRALMQKKRFYFQNLQKAERYALQLKNSNMETLLLQGVRMPYFNTEEARRRIGLIDRICYAVFGKSEWMEISGSIDLGEFDGENGLAATFKFLS